MEKVRAQLHVAANSQADRSGGGGVAYCPTDEQLADATLR
jgi:hypothetical protein